MDARVPVCSGQRPVCPHQSPAVVLSDQRLLGLVTQELRRPAELQRTCTTTDRDGYRLLSGIASICVIMPLTHETCKYNLANKSSHMRAHAIIH